MEHSSSCYACSSMHEGHPAAVGWKRRLAQRKDREEASRVLQKRTLSLSLPPSQQGKRVEALARGRIKLHDGWRCPLTGMYCHKGKRP
jgi:hypothetical protein